MYPIDRFTNQFTIPPGDPLNPSSQPKVFTINEPRSRSQPPTSYATSTQIKPSQVKMTNILRPILDEENYDKAMRDSRAALNTERSQNRRNKDVPTLGSFTQSEEEEEDIIPHFTEKVQKKVKPSPFAPVYARRRRSSSRESTPPPKSSKRKTPPKRGKHKRTPSPKRSHKKSKKRSPTPDVFSSDDNESFVEKDLEDTDSQGSTHSKRSSRGSKSRRSPKRHTSNLPRDDAISPKRDANGCIDFKYIDWSNRMVSFLIIIFFNVSSFGY